MITGLSFYRLVILAAFFPGFATANSLRCDVIEVQRLTDTGDFVTSVYSDSSQDFEMIIDAETGKVFHPRLGNESFPYIDVIDKGSSQSSLKIVAYSHVGYRDIEGGIEFRNMKVIQVNTYTRGNEKPFIYLSGDEIAHGVCR